MKTNFAAIIVVVAFFLTGFTASAVPVPVTPAGQSTASAAPSGLSSGGHSGSASGGSGAQASKGQHSAAKDKDTVTKEYSNYETSNPILLDALLRLEKGYKEELKAEQATDSLDNPDALKTQTKIAGLLQLQEKSQSSKNLGALRGNFASKLLKDASFVTVIGDWWGEPMHQKDGLKARYMLRVLNEAHERLVAELKGLHDDMKSKLTTKPHRDLAAY